MKRILFSIVVTALLVPGWTVSALEPPVDKRLYYDKQVRKQEKTGIIAVRWLKESEDALVVEVEYRYNGEAGEEISLRVVPEGSVQTIVSWPQQKTRVIKGRHKVKVVLSIPHWVKKTINTDLLTVSMNYLFIDESRNNNKYLASIMRRTFPYKKQWVLEK